MDLDREEGTGSTRPTGRSRWRWTLLLGLLILVVTAILWTWWAESHPREERRLRTLVRDELRYWFPDQMAPEEGRLGFYRRTPEDRATTGRVLLIHGLDEPGSIWSDLIPALDAAGCEVWELLYPNDQGIDQSADDLAAHWGRLPPGPPLVLIGHSMGGLVARDFVSRRRHPVGTTPTLAGPAVAGVILVGTPNQGSEWARLRIWLELREQFTTLQQKRFSLFAALRDGAGEAKLDLRPGSDFLETLNARPWPREVPVQVIAGRLLTAPDPTAGFAVIAAETQSSDLVTDLTDWWSLLGDDLGDGVVSLESAKLPGGPPPLVIEASHRGMLHRLLPGDPEPPAIAAILDILGRWSVIAVPHRAAEPREAE